MYLIISICSALSIIFFIFSFWVVVQKRNWLLVTEDGGRYMSLLVLAAFALSLPALVYDFIAKDEHCLASTASYSGICLILVVVVIWKIDSIIKKSSHQKTSAY